MRKPSFVARRALSLFVLLAAVLSSIATSTQELVPVPVPARAGAELTFEDESQEHRFEVRLDGTIERFIENAPGTFGVLVRKPALERDGGTIPDELVDGGTGPEAGTQLTADEAANHPSALSVEVRELLSDGDDGPAATGSAHIAISSASADLSLGVPFELRCHDEGCLPRFELVVRGPRAIEEVGAFVAQLLLSVTLSPVLGPDEEPSDLSVELVPLDDGADAGSPE